MRFAAWVPMIASLALAGCSAAPTSENSGFTASAAAPDAAVAAPQVVNTPDTRVMQVAWTSARADRCQFFYDLPVLKSSYLGSEQAAGATPETIARLDKAFEFTRSSVAGRIAGNANYCNRESNIKEIRADLNRYLAGDFSARAVQAATPVE